MLPTLPWRILIIEDDPEKRAELRSLLRQGSGGQYTVLEASTAAEGVRVVREGEGGPPDCVLLDYDLPDGKGDEVMAELVGDDGVLLSPVVVIMNGTRADLGHRALRAGAEDMIGKPWMTAESLVRVVDNAVERWTMARELRASEARFRQLAAAVPQAVWMVDAQGKLVYANDLWHAYFGELAQACRLGDWREVHAPDERDSFDPRCLPQAHLQRDCRLRGADGQYRWHQVNAVPIFDRAGSLTHWYGVNTDIHARKMAEQRLAVEHAVSQILARAASFADAVPSLLRAIAGGLGMDVCALWMADDDGRVLRCRETFDVGDPRFEDFLTQTRTMICTPGVGLTGRVWQSRQAEWLTSVATSPRARAAFAAGLASGVAYPVLAGQLFVGVIELFSTSALPSDPALLAMLSALGNELGQFVLRRRAERAALDNEAWLRLALKASRTGIWTWNLERDAVGWTPECYAIHGVSPDGFAGTGAAFFALLHPDDRARVETTVRVAITSRTDYACEFRVIRPGGEAIWVQSRGHATYTADGTPLHMLGTLTDIDEHKRIIDELARSEDRFARAQRAAHVGTWDWNVVTGEASWTDGAWQVFRGAAADTHPVTYDRWLGCVHPDDRERTAITAREALVTGVYRDEYRVRHVTGEIRWVEAVAEVVFDAAGAPDRMIGTVRDVTARREADRALRAALEAAEQAVRARDQLVSLISHDLRTPLGTLSMELSLLKMRGEREDDGRRYLGNVARMGRQVATMTRMIEELLDAAVLHAGKPLELERREVDLVELTRGMIADHQGSAGGHQLELRAQAEHVIGLWDPGRLERAIGNLIANAIKYSPRGGSVVVDIVALDGELAVLRVKDDGIGILPTDQARVFEWFARGENAKRSEIPGTGIGLAGAKQIVEQHGGSISLESEAGKGSTFTVRLPTHLWRGGAG
jgi:PAS domain S-box-containing protein